MNDLSAIYEPLTVETLPERLGNLTQLNERLGADIAAWQVREVGDGNLNLVFIVKGPAGSVVVKQALPYVRLIGESWPLPLKRAFFEYHALTRQAARDPGLVPEIYHFDERQALIVMEHLSPHVILRYRLIEGKKTEGLGNVLGQFCARTLFKGSDLSLDGASRKADLALFAGNVAMCDITEQVVFTDPYFAAEMNRHTTPQLDGIAAQLRADMDLKVEAQHLKMRFCTAAETLLHGDLHTGSIMATDSDLKMIDPEFAFYGPMGFDVGMLLSNLFMAYFSQSGHGERAAYQDWLLDVIATVWEAFGAEFGRLWNGERTGMLYPESVLEDRRHNLAARQALDHRLASIWSDALGFCGVEIHRRILGVAHNADFETITDTDKRSECETRALWFGRHVVVNRARIGGMGQVLDLARQLEAEAI